VNQRKLVALMPRRRRASCRGRGLLRDETSRDGRRRHRDADRRDRHGRGPLESASKKARRRPSARAGSASDRARCRSRPRVGSDRPIEGARSVEAGLRVPTSSEGDDPADGGSRSRSDELRRVDVPREGARAAADSELAASGVIENRETDLGTVYLAPPSACPGSSWTRGHADRGASVRADRSRSTSSSIDILRLIRELPSRPAAVDSAVRARTGSSS